jgi:hypothetical protein
MTSHYFFNPNKDFFFLVTRHSYVTRFQMTEAKALKQGR